MLATMKIAMLVAFFLAMAGVRWFVHSVDTEFGIVGTGLIATLMVGGP